MVTDSLTALLQARFMLSVGVAPDWGKTILKKRRPRACGASRFSESGSADFRLIRYFTLASLAAFAAVALALAYFEGKEAEFFGQVQRAQAEFFRDVEDSHARRQNDAARNGLLAVHEAGNVNLTRLFANALWERDFAPFVGRAAALPVDDQLGKRIMELPGFKALDAKVFDAMKKSSVFKIKVYDLRGITVYSSEHAQIGEDKSLNAGWKGAMAGAPASELVHRDRFNAFDGEIENRDLIQSYLPVYSPSDGEIAGVFEVYSDVTPFLARIEATSAGLMKLAADNRATVEAVAARNQAQVESRARLLIGVVLGLLALLWVITFLVVRNGQRIIDRQQAERALAQRWLSHSEKMAALGGLVAGVTHQLNTPLAFSRSNINLVIDRLKARDAPLKLAAPGDAATMRDMLGDVLHGLDRMSEFVTHIREFTRLDRAEVCEVDLNRSLQSVLYMARSVIPGRVTIVEQYGELPPLLCSPSQLNQVFLNLVSNAAQAIEGSGTITVRTASEGDKVRVEISDDGCGIPPEVLPRIFEQYFTTKPEGKGTGLGLTIALDVVRAHGGDICAASRPGEGSTFTVVLPLRGAAALGKAA
jgi:signal transduction histidine kinase